MSAIFSLDRARGALFDALGRQFDLQTRAWSAGAEPSGDAVDAIAAARWLQRESGAPIRVPIGVIGPRDATDAQLAVAHDVGAALADIGFAIVCGGRHGVMESVCKGAAQAGGVSIVVATGIGEARNALIARASLCLVAIGDSFGTLSEVALGRHFGKLVVGLEGAAQVAGVVHIATVDEALAKVAAFALAAGA